MLIQYQPKLTLETKPQTGCRSTHMKEPGPNPVSPARTTTSLVCVVTQEIAKTGLRSVCKHSPAQHGGPSLPGRLALKSVTRRELTKHTFCCHAPPATGESLRALADRDSKLHAKILNWRHISWRGSGFLNRERKRQKVRARVSQQGHLKVPYYVGHTSPAGLRS